LEFNEPSSIVAVPEFNKFLVHCETTLSSYPLDKIIGVSQGGAAIKDLGASEERLDQDHGDILFLKVGRIVDRTVGKRLVTSPAAFRRFSYQGSYFCGEEFQDGEEFRDGYLACA